jgi:hypothetical protein
MSGRGKASGSGKARAKAKTRSSKAGLQFPVVCFRKIKDGSIKIFYRVVFIAYFVVVILLNESVLALQFI